MATPSSIRRVADTARCSIQCLRDRPSSGALRQLTRTSASAPSLPSSRARTFSTAPYIAERTEDEAPQIPRWQQTPKGMQMPFRVRPRSPRNRTERWKVNEDPRVLAEFYNSFLGEGGAQMLSEETMWLAVTHKTFDQGRRGFNDRLSYIGKRTLSLQTSLLLTSQPPIHSQPPPTSGTTGTSPEPEPFTHPLLDGLPNLSESSKSRMLAHERLSQLGKRHGLERVLRWLPRMVDNLTGSGQSVIMAQAIYAIVGAVALERGKVDADRICRERILGPLGLGKGRGEI